MLPGLMGQPLEALGLLFCWPQLGDLGLSPLAIRPVGSCEAGVRARQPPTHPSTVGIRQ